MAVPPVRDVDLMCRGSLTYNHECLSSVSNLSLILVSERHFNHGHILASPGVTPYGFKLGSELELYSVRGSQGSSGSSLSSH